jgi:hypothetical protein
MSTQQPPVIPSMSRGLQTSPRPGLNGLLPFILLLLVVAAVIIAFSLAIFLAGKKSPTEVFEEYVDASNDRDIRRMFDQTVLRFAPDYEFRLAILEVQVFIYDPETTIISATELLKEDMDPGQIGFAEDLVSEVEDELGIVVEDYCFVEYRITIEYRALQDAEETFDGEMLCVQVEGDWYLVVPGYF